MMDIFIPMACGGSTCFADKNALKGTLVDNLKYYRTTRFIGVPRVWEKIEEPLRVNLSKTTGLKKMLVDWARKQSLAHHEREMSGKMDNSLGYRLARKLVLSKIHEGLGLDKTVANDFAIGRQLKRSKKKYFTSLQYVIQGFFKLYPPFKF